MLTISPPESMYFAELSDGADGVHVVVWRKATARRQYCKRIDVWLLDCPWHLACDHVHDLLAELKTAED